jgi:hypothetical protein
MSDEDLETWCDEHLPDIYDEGMFDYEDIQDEVWEAYNTLAAETVLDFIEDDDEREEISDRLHEIAGSWFEGYHAALIESLLPRTEAEIAALCTAPQVAQHSAEWYAQRRNRLTASEFAQILDGRRGALLRAKLDTTGQGDRPTSSTVAIAQADGEMNATSWGHRFEPVTRRIYELEIAGVDTVNDHLGRFTHRTIPWLSASPDGLVVKGPLMGRLLEIKSPKTRKPGAFVPDEYYIQMQIQMEVCDLDAVDFIEAQFAQRPVYFGNQQMDIFGVPTAAARTRPLSAEDDAAMRAAQWKGRIEVYGYLDSSDTWTYRYSEPVEDIEDIVMPAPPEDLPLLEASVWWLTGWFPRTVMRNRTWWDAIGLPAAELFWTQVVSGREAQGSVLQIEEDGDTIKHITIGGWMGR